MQVSTLRCKNCGKVFSGLRSALSEIPDADRENMGIGPDFGVHYCDTSTRGILELIAIKEDSGAPIDGPEAGLSQMGWRAQAKIYDGLRETWEAYAAVDK